MSCLSKEVRVRFAPSPTGYLHMGGVRALIFSWLYAKKNKSTLILRIENTDQVRSNKEAENLCIEAIKLLGIEYDEGPIKNGDFGPYRQSDRIDIYQKYVDELLSKKMIYPCFCPSEFLQVPS